MMAPDMTHLPTVSPDDLLARLHTLELVAQRYLELYGPTVAAASVALGGVLLVVGLLTGWRPVQRLGVTLAVAAVGGYVLALVVVHGVLTMRYL